MPSHYMGSVKKIALLIASSSLATGVMANPYDWGQADLMPDRSGATIRTAQAAQSSHLDGIDQHLAELRQKQSFGEDFWGRVQGFSGDKDRTSDGDGYDVDGYSLLLGTSWQHNSNQIMGASFGYTEQEAKTSQLDNRHDIRSYQMSLYSLWDMDDYYISGALSVGSNIYQSRRNITSTGVANDFADSEYQGYHIALRASVGKDYLFNDIHVQPRISTELNHLTINSYEEEEDGSDASLGYKQQGVEQIKLGVGVSAFKDISLNKGSLKPLLSFMAWSDFNNNNEELKFYALNHNNVYGTVRKMDGSSSYTINLDASVNYNYGTRVNIEGGVGHMIQDESNTTAFYLKAGMTF